MGKETLEVVKGVDLKRYMGLWYEIASRPCLSQPRNGINTTAKYTLNEDGTVHVLNETYTNGKKSSIEGTAYKADPKSEEAKLKVKFTVPPFRPLIPVYGNYWILLLDDDYQWALIGEPTRKSLWAKNLQHHCSNIRLLIILFDQVQFQHVFRQHNKEADILSKKGLDSPEGLLQIEEIKNDFVIRFSTHRIFC